jgi:hypothetical protein
MTIYHVDHFYGFFSAFNANTIDDITLIKGGFPAKYGGRISSVMEITGKPADMEKFHGGASISLLSANGFFEVPFPGNKVSLQLAARRSECPEVEWEVEGLAGSRSHRNPSSISTMSIPN